MAPPRFVHKKISGKDFDAELARQKINRATFARLWCQNLAAVKRWGTESTDVPNWVPIALTLMTLPDGARTARMAAAAMIEQDRWHPELGAFPYQKLRQMPVDVDQDEDA